MWNLAPCYFNWMTASPICDQSFCSRSRLLRRSHAASWAACLLQHLFWQHSYSSTQIDWRKKQTFDLCLVWLLCVSDVIGIEWWLIVFLAMIIIIYINDLIIQRLFLLWYSAFNFREDSFVINDQKTSTSLLSTFSV